MADEEGVVVPVAFCETCDQEVPVVITEVTLDTDDVPEEIFGLQLDVVVCPVCVNVLNNEGDISIKYYEIDDIEQVTSFKAEEDGRESEQ